jgi:hypothetical protein
LARAISRSLCGSLLKSMQKSADRDRPDRMIMITGIGYVIT